MAYLVGIIFDRFADTLLEDIEQYSRLKVALDVKKPPPKIDPFPESAYRMKVLGNPEAFTYANYIRTRIRLSRAMAILIPGLSVSFLLYNTRKEISRTWWIVAAVSVGVIYGGALVAQIVHGKKIAPKDEPGKEKKTKTVWRIMRAALDIDDFATGKEKKTVWYKVPKTYELLELQVFMETKRKIWWRIVREPFSWVITFLTGLGLILASQAGQSAFLSVPLLSIALTLLTFWTWWRINKTFLEFLKDYSKYSPPEIR